MHKLTRTLLLLSAALVLALPLSAQRQSDAPQQYPLQLLGIHSMILMETGELYLFAETPVGYADETPDFDHAVRLDFAQMFPTVASFDDFDNASEGEKQQTMWNAMAYVTWDGFDLDKDSILAQGTVLLDLNETDYSELQTDFEDHIGAMAEAWSTALKNPFSAGSEPIDITAMLSDGELETEESWATVKKWGGKVASGAWKAGKWVAKKGLPVAQAGEFCLTAGNLIVSSVSAGEWPAGEDWAELCFDAGECIPYAGIGVAVAHEAWCLWDY